MPLTPIDLVRLPGNEQAANVLGDLDVALDNTNGNSVQLNGPRGTLLFFMGVGQVVLQGAQSPILGQRNTRTINVEAGKTYLLGPLNPFFWEYEDYAVRINGPATVSVVAYAY